MAHNDPEERNWDELKRLGYEPQDLDVNLAVKGTVAFYAFVVMALAGAGFMFWLLNRDAFNVQAPTSAFVTRVPRPPYPLLQTNITSKTDIRELRQNETRLLTTYSRVDPGHIRLPIDRAIDLVLERDLIKGEPHPLVQGNDSDDQ
jgi:hypothetical protein